MEKVSSFKDLKNLYEKYKPILGDRLEDSSKKRTLMVCGGTGCHASQSQEIATQLEHFVKENGLQDSVNVSITGCFGFCEKGPIVKVFPDDIFYVEVTPEDAQEIVERHLVEGNVVSRLLYEEPSLKKKVAAQHDISFYKKQHRIALRNCGLINPEKIEEYIANKGYQALGKALTEMSPEEVIEVVKKSGLRGRGGGGFPTGLKWDITRKVKSEEKYIICNADEGDPGAFMDRSIMEGDSHSVLEAMAIAAYSFGASKGVIYIRAEYPLAIERLKMALSQGEALGLIGKNIMGTGFNFEVSIKLGAGAFVCGEETALIHSIEGERGEPTSKPPFPSEKGVWGTPSNVNNVETLANIPEIILKGADWFSSIGTEKSKGTKVFALAGQINNVGLVEVPMGTTLREIIYDIGGGINTENGGTEFKAVQTGGPSGGCITAEDLDTPIDYESLGAIGSMMGSGGMIVMNEKDCMVNIAKFYLEFTVDESCGKCTPCRVGNKRLHEILTRITEGQGTEEDLFELEELSNVIKDTSLCGLGQTAPNPVLSTLKYFREEYEAHVKEKRCPSHRCEKLLSYHILPDLCIGCTACARKCPVDCISGKPKEVHHIDQSKCIKCGVCMASCKKFKAIIIE